MAAVQNPPATTALTVTQHIAPKRLDIGFEDMTISSPEDIQRRIIELEVEHRDLDSVIDLLILDVRHEELQLRRLKKRKLQLKDHITLLKMQLVPDIPA